MRKTTKAKVVPTEPATRVIVAAPSTGNGGLFFRALILGALVGAVLALLKARQSGATTRAQVQSLVETTRHQAREVVNEARLAIEDFTAWAADEDDIAPPLPEPSAEALTLAMPAVTPPVAPVPNPPSPPSPRPIVEPPTASADAPTRAMPVPPAITINEALTTALPAVPPPSPPDDTPTAPLPKLPRH